ncbi:hypothetical protein TrST_g5893 [Triparma strigata]|uniref:G domain-containing protein n=1 Tax=Triparma strigata TaxID=1606541 RepID=A0A9W7DWX2_9STRA|nr:hypothetical protein TrST_g5893 [Triparma strigata]
MAMFVDDFVEEELENPSLKIVLLGPPQSGKSTLLCTLLKTPSPPPPTYTISYHETTMNSMNLMIYDTPSNIFKKSTSKKSNDSNISTPSATADAGGVVICLDIITSLNSDEGGEGREGDDKFSRLYSYLSVVRGEFKGRLPPIVLAFTMWDMAENLGWETKGSDLRRDYGEVLRVFDSVFRRDCNKKFRPLGERKND